MTTSLYLRFAEVSLVLLLAAAVIFAWREERADRAQLQVQLAAANQALAAATTRQQDRDATLNTVLTGIAAEKKAATTPDQFLAAIVTGVQPKAKGSSIGEAAASAANQSSTGATQAQSTATPQVPTAPDAKIPAADIKPLYDYVLDCKACQAKLTAAQNDLTDEKSKTATLTKSRDDAVRAANGGSILKRTLRALKWFAIGAAAGAIAAKAVR
jgi:hypothetical protein